VPATPVNEAGELTSSASSSAGVWLLLAERARPRHGFRVAPRAAPLRPWDSPAVALVWIQAQVPLDRARLTNSATRRGNSANWLTRVPARFFPGATSLPGQVSDGAGKRLCDQA
jgi:hypothetical protein